MKILTVLILFTTAVVAAESCPEKLEKRTFLCTASPAEREKIMGYIRIGVNAHKDFELAKENEKKLRDEIMELWQQGRQSSLEQGKRWEEANKLMVTLEDKMQANLDKALELTSLYYGLGREERGIANGPLKGYTASWKPHFLYAPLDELGNYKPVYWRLQFPSEPTKEPHYLAVDFGKKKDAANEDVTQARTLEDGSVSVSIEAFREALDEGVNSPRLLAKTLYHEGVHHKHLVTDGWTNEEEMEAEAWGESFDAVEIFELTQEEKDKVESRKQTEEWFRDEVRAGRQRQTLPFSSDFIQRDFKKGFEDARKEFRHEDQQRDVLEKGLADTREAVEKAREERSRRAEEQREQEKIRSHMLALGEIAMQACSNPGSVTQAMIDEVGFMDGRVYRDWRRAPGSGCQFALFAEMLRMLELVEARNLSPAWLNGWRETYDWRDGKKILDSYGFYYEGMDNRKYFYFSNSVVSGERYIFPVKYLDDLRAALFLAKTCLAGRIAEPSREALEILAENIGDSAFRDRIKIKSSGGGSAGGWVSIDHCYSSIFLGNYQFLTDREGIEKLLSIYHKQAQDREKYFKELEKRNRKIEEQNRKRKQEGGRGGGDREWGGRNNRVPTLDEILRRLK